MKISTKAKALCYVLDCVKGQSNRLYQIQAALNEVEADTWDAAIRAQCKLCFVGAKHWVCEAGKLHEARRKEQEG